MVFEDSEGEEDEGVKDEASGRWWCHSTGLVILEEQQAGVVQGVR